MNLSRLPGHPPRRLQHGAIGHRACSAWIGTLLAATVLLATACSGPDAPPIELTGHTMGTSYSIKLIPDPGIAARDSLQQAVDARLAEINRQMSTYLPDSDLMRFNLAQSDQWQAVPAALVELIERAQQISLLSDGMYDVTVGPLVNLWGFGSSGTRDTPPTAQQIAALLPLVGFKHLQTRRSPPGLRKAVTGLQVDLSSIAKGWAVDQIAGLLRERGVRDFLVEIGGEVYASGEKHPGEGWHIAIEQPLYDRRAVERVIELHDMAVATSGDYRNFFPAGDRLYSHTIDPRSGQAVQHRLASVTVLADNCTDADAWATALMALGDRRAGDLADRQGLKALLILRGDRGLIEQPSKALSSSATWRGQH
jgi:thiamine biosynthesis lipoprotein